MFAFLIFNWLKIKFTKMTVTRRAQSHVTCQRSWIAKKCSGPVGGMTAPAADLTAERSRFSNPTGVSALLLSPSGGVGSSYKGAE